MGGCPHIWSPTGGETYRCCRPSCKTQGVLVDDTITAVDTAIRAMRELELTEDEIHGVLVEKGMEPLVAQHLQEQVKR